MPEIDATLGAGIGLGFAFTASFASAVGLSLIKKAHNIKKAERSRKFTGPAKGLVVCGNFLLTFVSSSFDLVAMLFAPIELLSPVAGVTLILNIFVAPCIVHEKVHTVDLLSAVVMVPGLVLSIIFGPTGEQKMTTELLEERMGRSPWVAFELLVAALLLACLLVFRASSRILASPDVDPSRSSESFHGTSGSDHDDDVEAGERAAANTPGLPSGVLWRFVRALRPFCNPVLAAVIGGQQLIMSKLALMLLDTSAYGDNQFLKPTTYLIIIMAVALAILQVYIINVALKVADALIVVPTYQALLIIAGTMTSSTFFNTFSGYEPWKLALFSAGVFLVVVGVAMLSQRPEGLPKAPEDGSDSSSGAEQPASEVEVQVVPAGGGGVVPSGACLAKGVEMAEIKLAVGSSATTPVVPHQSARGVAQRRAVAGTGAGAGAGAGAVANDGCASATEQPLLATTTPRRVLQRTTSFTGEPNVLRAQHRRHSCGSLAELSSDLVTSLRGRFELTMHHHRSSQPKAV